MGHLTLATPLTIPRFVTRSHKHNDRDHQGIAEGTADPEQHYPRYFAKHGHVDADPKKTKKDGGGKGNWGRDGDELEDSNFNLTNPRRRSNSFHQTSHELKTKFETVDPEPVFEEEIHGDAGYDDEGVSAASTTGDKEDSLSGGSAESLAEEDLEVNTTTTTATRKMS